MFGILLSLFQYDLRGVCLRKNELNRRRLVLDGSEKPLLLSLFFFLKVFFSVWFRVQTRKFFFLIFQSEVWKRVRGRDEIAFVSFWFFYFSLCHSTTFLCSSLYDIFLKPIRSCSWVFCRISNVYITIAELNNSLLEHISTNLMKSWYNESATTLGDQKFYSM